MAKGLNSKGLGTGFALNPISKRSPKKAAGIYPGKGSGLGEYGSTHYATVIEAYDSESHFHRWKVGQQFYESLGSSWIDRQQPVLTRFPVGDRVELQRSIVAIFPGGSSPERAWYSAVRVRGSIIFAQALRGGQLKVEQNRDDPSKDRLVYDISETTTVAQRQIFPVFIGDQFEDSADGPSFPEDLIPEPAIDIRAGKDGKYTKAGAIAFTLVDVDVAGAKLYFDITRPCARVRVNGHVRWKRLTYYRNSPYMWELGRHVCSSFKFSCSCPDYCGAQVADLIDPDENATLKTFPLPNAKRSVTQEWERQNVGYIRQWRTLPQRFDQRRECKHIHAYRWSCGVPWWEPSDYMFGADANVLEIGTVDRHEHTLENTDIMNFYRRYAVDYDRAMIPLGQVIGINPFPEGDVFQGKREPSGPILWQTGEEPPHACSRPLDWWLKRGSQQLSLYNPLAAERSLRGYVQAVMDDGRLQPIAQFVDASNPDAPVIVK